MKNKKATPKQLMLIFSDHEKIMTVSHFPGILLLMRRANIHSGLYFSSFFCPQPSKLFNFSVQVLLGSEALFLGFWLFFFF